MKKLHHSMKNAFKGILYAYVDTNIKIITLVVVIFSTTVLVFVPYFSLQLLMIVFGIGAIVVEMINTAVEHFIDFVYPAYHPDCGKIKDILAGSSLLISIATAIVFLRSMSSIF
ncbi:MAG TPA: diacylglycerol kinase family protein [Candidatus Absconditabacterales bacterium]|nr:diacylglycerol kinase family protein [Candidatus Absconditabacterales bacterium]